MEENKTESGSVFDNKMDISEGVPDKAETKMQTVTDETMLSKNDSERSITSPDNKTAHLVPPNKTTHLEPDNKTAHLEPVDNKTAHLESVAQVMSNPIGISLVEDYSSSSSGSLSNDVDPKPVDETATNLFTASVKQPGEQVSDDQVSFVNQPDPLPAEANVDISDDHVSFVKQPKPLPAEANVDISQTDAVDCFPPTCDDSVQSEAENETSTVVPQMTPESSVRNFGAISEIRESDSTLKTDNAINLESNDDGNSVNVSENQDGDDDNKMDIDDVPAEIETGSEWSEAPMPDTPLTDTIGLDTPGPDTPIGLDTPGPDTPLGLDTPGPDTPVSSIQDPGSVSAGPSPSKRSRQNSNDSSKPELIEGVIAHQ